MAEQQVIDFDNMNFDQKKEFVIKGLLSARNFTDPAATTLDWSDSMPGLFSCNCSFRIDTNARF